MGLYRILRPVDKGGEVGGICAFAWLTEAQVDRLVALGIVAPVQAPPLSVFAGWTRRSARFGEIGIERADQFLEADTSMMAAELGVKPATVARWKQEVAQLLKAPATGERPRRRR